MLAKRQVFACKKLVAGVSVGLVLQFGVYVGKTPSFAGKNLRLGHLGGINLKLGSMLAKRCLGKGVGGGCVLSLDLYE